MNVVLRNPSNEGQIHIIYIVLFSTKKKFRIKCAWVRKTFVYAESCIFILTLADLFSLIYRLWNIEPDDTKHIENCGAINIQAAVSDEVCNERHGYICEYPITSM